MYKIYWQTNCITDNLNGTYSTSYGYSGGGIRYSSTNALNKPISFYTISPDNVSIASLHRILLTSTYPVNLFSICESGENSTTICELEFNDECYHVHYYGEDGAYTYNKIDSLPINDEWTFLCMEYRKNDCLVLYSGESVVFSGNVYSGNPTTTHQTTVYIGWTSTPTNAICVDYDNVSIGSGYIPIGINGLLHTIDNYYFRVASESYHENQGLLPGGIFLNTNYYELFSYWDKLSTYNISFYLYNSQLTNNNGTEDNKLFYSNMGAPAFSIEIQKDNQYYATFWKHNQNGRMPIPHNNYLYTNKWNHHQIIYNIFDNSCIWYINNHLVFSSQSYSSVMSDILQNYTNLAGFNIHEVADEINTHIYDLKLIKTLDFIPHPTLHVADNFKYNPFNSQYTQWDISTETINDIEYNHNASFSHIGEYKYLIGNSVRCTGSYLTKTITDKKYDIGLLLQPISLSYTGTIISIPNLCTISQSGVEYVLEYKDIFSVTHTTSLYNVQTNWDYIWIRGDHFNDTLDVRVGISSWIQVTGIANPIYKTISIGNSNTYLGYTFIVGLTYLDGTTETAITNHKAIGDHFYYTKYFNGDEVLSPNSFYQYQWLEAYNNRVNIDLNNNYLQFSREYNGYDTYAIPDRIYSYDANYYLKYLNFVLRLYSIPSGRYERFYHDDNMDLYFAYTSSMLRIETADGIGFNTNIGQHNFEIIFNSGIYSVYNNKILQFKYTSTQTYIDEQYFYAPTGDNTYYEIGNIHKSILPASSHVVVQLTNSCDFYTTSTFGTVKNINLYSLSHATYSSELNLMSTSHLGIDNTLLGMTFGKFPASSFVNIYSYSKTGNTNNLNLYVESHGIENEQFNLYGLSNTGISDIINVYGNFYKGKVNTLNILESSNIGAINQINTQLLGFPGNVESISAYATSHIGILGKLYSYGYAFTGKVSKMNVSLPSYDENAYVSSELNLFLTNYYVTDELNLYIGGEPEYQKYAYMQITIPVTEGTSLLNSYMQISIPYYPNTLNSSLNSFVQGNPNNELNLYTYSLRYIGGTTDSSANIWTTYSSVLNISLSGST